MRETVGTEQWIKREGTSKHRGGRYRHLGIIAGIIDEIGMVDIINRKVGEHPQAVYPQIDHKYGWGHPFGFKSGQFFLKPQKRIMVLMMVMTLA